MPVKPWKWVREDDEYGGGWKLLDGRGRNRANVWGNGTWHSWDTDGVGGENSVAISMDGDYKRPRAFVVKDAMDQAMAAVARQGWTPWKVEYQKQTPKDTKKQDGHSCYMCKGTGERGGFPCPECGAKRKCRCPNYISVIDGKCSVCELPVPEKREEKT